MPLTAAVADVSDVRDRRRRLRHMYEVEGLTYAEIARVEGRSIEAVRRVVKMARLYNIKP
jgi:DNA-directed RNA polymerase specialized sigma24 family protein